MSEGFSPGFLLLIGYRGPYEPRKPQFVRELAGKYRSEYEASRERAPSHNGERKLEPGEVVVDLQTRRGRPPGSFGQEMICAQCQKPFRSRVKTQRTCGYACAALLRRREEDKKTIEAEFNDLYKGKGF